jgi:transcriptional regulator with XRE-family HTH domain
MKITREYKRNLNQDNWFYVELGKRLKQARYTKVNEFTGKEYVVTQTAVASCISSTFQQVQKYEKGINRIPLINLVKIAKFLKKPLSYFLDIQEPNEELQMAYKDAMDRLSENR